ncbi:MAG: hypothetical protein ACQEXJ_24250 [Myxococcota bacterium]
MKRMMLPALMLAIALVIGACEKKGQEETGAAEGEAATQAGGAAAEGEDHAHEGEGEDHAHEGEGEHHAAEGEDHAHEGEGEHHAGEGEEAETVEVAEAGTKFDPPIPSEKLPEGVWYCDMGTVHWAGQDKPEEGRCPLCKMKVKKYEGAAGGEMGHEGEHGHEHEGEHDHAH